MKIRIIASKPNGCQKSIQSLVGKTFETERQFKRKVEIRVSVPDWGSVILNPGEYEILETKPSNEK